MTHLGTVTSVEALPLGTEVKIAAAAGALVLNVYDVTDFNETGGQVEIAGSVRDYLSADTELDTITLALGLPAAVAVDDPIYVYPPAVDTTAWVLLAGESEAIPATIPHGMQDVLTHGVRNETEREEVELDHRDYTWSVRDVIDRPLARQSAYLEGPIDPEILPPTTGSDGVVPAQVTGLTLTPGLGFLFARWLPVTTNANGAAQTSIVEYDVYISKTASFTKNSTTKVGQTAGSMISIKTDAAGTPLVPLTADDPPVPQLYYVAVQARDTDGAGAVSTEASSAVGRVTGPDIAANAVSTNHLAARAVTADQIAAEIVLSSRFTTGVIDPNTGNVTGRRIELDPTGLFTYEPDGSPRVEMPTDPLLPNVFRGNAEIDRLTVRAGVSFEGTDNEVAEGSTLSLAAGITAPTNPPSLTTTYETVNLGVATGQVFPHDFPNVRGLGWDSTLSHYVVAFLRPSTTAQEVHINKYTTAGAWVSKPLVWGHGADMLGGVDWYNKTIYFLSRRASDQQWLVWWYNTDSAVTGGSGVKYGSWEGGTALQNSLYKPAMSIDKANGDLLIAFYVASFNGMRIVRYPAASIHTLTTPAGVTFDQGVGDSYPSMASDFAAVEYNTTDFGGTGRYITTKLTANASDPQNTKIYGWQPENTTGGAIWQRDAQTWSRGSGDVMGLTFQGTKWRAINAAGQIRTYELATSVGGLISAAYTWYDAVSPIGETTRSPIATYTKLPRARIQLVSAPIPSSGGVDSIRVYLAQGNAGTTKGNMYLQGRVVPVGTAAPVTTMSNPTYSGTFDPLSTVGFATGQAAFIDTTSGGFSIDGAGNGSVGTAGFKNSVITASKENYKNGTSTLTTDTAGDIVITHNLGVAPTTVVWGTSTAGQYRYLTASKTGINTITIRCFDTTGVVRGSGFSVTLDWLVIK